MSCCTVALQAPCASPTGDVTSSASLHVLLPQNVDLHLRRCCLAGDISRRQTPVGTHADSAAQHSHPLAVGKHVGLGGRDSRRIATGEHFVDSCPVPGEIAVVQTAGEMHGWTMVDGYRRRQAAVLDYERAQSWWFGTAESSCGCSHYEMEHLASHGRNHEGLRLDYLDRHHSRTEIR